jgi:hypothetical protein
MFVLYQTAFGKLILEGQLSKLGILPPEGTFWPALKTAFNTMWANNGDVLSRQYAGTNALKVLFCETTKLISIVYLWDIIIPLII